LIGLGNGFLGDPLGFGNNGAMLVCGLRTEATWEQKTTHRCRDKETQIVIGGLGSLFAATKDALLDSLEYEP